MEIQSSSAEQTTIRRLLTEAHGWVDQFGLDLLICSRQNGAENSLLVEAKEFCRARGLAFQRIFHKSLQQNPGEHHGIELLEGDASLCLQTVCRELGLLYAIDFASGYSNGFFLDQRENRRFLLGLRPARTLNLFAYTCSFSVVAASVGSATCSVDVAKKALDWGRQNFALNALPLDGHRFFADDAREVARRLFKRGDSFEAIIVDPPTFARNREGKIWRVEKDYAELVESVSRLLVPGGHLLLSTNYSLWTEANLVDLADPTLEVVPIPKPEDLPAHEGALSVWLKKP